ARMVGERPRDGLRERVGRLLERVDVELEAPVALAPEAGGGVRPRHSPGCYAACAAESIPVSRGTGHSESDPRRTAAGTAPGRRRAPAPRAGAAPPPPPRRPPFRTPGRRDAGSRRPPRRSRGRGRRPR